MRRMFIAAAAAVLAVGCHAVPPQDQASGATRASDEAPAIEAAPPAALPEYTPAPPAPPAPARQRVPAADARSVPARPSAPAAPAPMVPEARTPAARLPEYREVMIPAGTMLPLRLVSALASDTSEVEDIVRATLASDIAMDEGGWLPAGTEFVGRVTDAERSGRVKGRARLAFRFTRLQYDGDEYDVRTEAIERVAEASTGKDAAKIAIGAGAGAAIGAILGGGSGAAKGAAIGGAAGTGTVLATRGNEVHLEPGEPVDTRLTAPLAVRIRVQ